MLPPGHKLRKQAVFRSLECLHVHWRTLVWRFHLSVAPPLAQLLYIMLSVHMLEVQDSIIANV